MRQPVPADNDAGRPSPCPTHRRLTAPPTDLLTFAEATAVLARTPHPVSERTLRRGFKPGRGLRTWQNVGRRGELVSMSDVFAWHRDKIRADMAAAA
jgi:hypothetical protein